MLECLRHPGCQPAACHEVTLDGDVPVQRLKNASTSGPSQQCTLQQHDVDLALVQLDQKPGIAAEPLKQQPQLQAPSLLPSMERVQVRVLRLLVSTPV